MTQAVGPSITWREESGGPLSSCLLRGAGPLESTPEALMALGAVYVNRERRTQESALSVGDWVRVHPRPRRFPLPPREPAVGEGDDFVVVRKPAGLPVHPTCDNLQENLRSLWEGWLGRPLWICHRLDVATEGLVVLGKSAAFARKFGAWLVEGKVEKFYRCLVPREVAAGLYEHWSFPSDRAPFAYGVLGWGYSSRRAALRVERCRPLGRGWELEVRLLTGRHHQIRAQLARLGSPVVGDVLYGSARPLPPEGGERIALQSFRLGWGTASFELPAPWGEGIDGEFAWF